MRRGTLASSNNIETGNRGGVLATERVQATTGTTEIAETAATEEARSSTA